MRSDGTVFPAELAIGRVEMDGPPVFTACIRDASDRRDTEARLKAAELRYRTLVEQLPLVSYVDRSDDPVSKPLYVSPQIETLLGHSAEDWLSVPDLYERSIHADDREWVLAAKRVAYERGERSRLEYRMTTADGRLVWVEDQSVFVGIDGERGFRQGFAVDITERKHAETALRQAETRFRTLVEQLPLAVYIDRMDEESSNIYTSPQIEPMLGYTRDEWVSDRSLFVAVLHPDDREPVLAAHAATHATGEPLHMDYRLISRDGRTIWVHDEARVITEPEGGGQVLQGYLLDITARREAEELLRHQAFHDPLTGLANRALFTDRVEHALVRRRAGGEAAVLFLDLDDFKAVNDTLGHLAGDTLLRAVGERLRDASAPSHTVARLGGDEFAILHRGREGRRGRRRRRARDRGPAGAVRRSSGREVFVTASVGIVRRTTTRTSCCATPTSPCTAPRAAARPQYVVYDAADATSDIVGRLELVADLRRVRARRGSRTPLPADRRPGHRSDRGRRGAGALAASDARARCRRRRSSRWPRRRACIVEIGRWVLAEACREPRAGAQRSRPRPAPVSVNVSTRQVQPAGARRGRPRRAASVGARPRRADARDHRERARATSRGR